MMWTWLELGGVIVHSTKRKTMHRVEKCLGPLTMYQCTHSEGGGYDYDIKVLREEVTTWHGCRKCFG